MPAKAVILDANLLVLLVVGSASLSYIPVHKRLSAYSLDDYRLLIRLIADASRIIVTPNIVTETSNLAGQIGEPARNAIFGVLHQLLQKTEEAYIESRHAADHGSFLRLGITDAALLQMDPGDTVLLTADLDLYLAAARHGREVINFNHHIAANRPFS